MTVSKLRHETFLDFELRKLSQGHRLTDDTYNEYIADNKKAILDSQGRHKSEWCYAAYDGRLESPNEKVETSWDILLDRYSRRKT